MIITGIRAENVLKYAVLDLPEIPRQGLIAVIGDNESGKSSIGESICFALFGRTFSLGPKDLDKVIRWGESRCSIRLDFATPDGGQYQIARFLDELGNHGASISRLGEAPMVRGVAEVESALRHIIGFGYDELIESFYLAQREITTPHPHSHAVKVMAGVDALERVAATCRAEIPPTEEKIAATEAERDDILAQIAALDLKPGHLMALEQAHGEESAQAEAGRARIQALRAQANGCDQDLERLRETAADWLAATPAASFTTLQRQTADLDATLAALAPRYAESAPPEAIAGLRALAREAGEGLAEFRRLRASAADYAGRLAHFLGDTAEEVAGEVPPAPVRQAALADLEARCLTGRRRSRALATLFGVLALVLAAGWALLGQSPAGEASEVLRTWLATLPAGWDGAILSWMPLGIGLLLGGTASFWALARHQSSRLSTCRDDQQALAAETEAGRTEIAALAELETRPLADAIAIIASLREPALAQGAARFADGLGAPLIAAEAQFERPERFRRAVEGLRLAIIGIKSEALRGMERLHEAAAEHAGSLARQEAQIAQERGRVRRDAELRAIHADLERRVAELRRRVQARTLALELLDGAIHYISQRFNTEVRNLAAESLPRLTNGRYEHLQIDTNLRVKAFSNEKRNFMDLDEISSGTQRQIMLAVRLALSQKLVNSAIHGPQMLFLDEPFAFFDEARTTSALAILPKVSGDFTQIWVTSQTFPEGSKFDLVIECHAGEGLSPWVRRS
jgi:DNA repair exonuclease SbcCD ATPase subunit